MKSHDEKITESSNQPDIKPPVKKKEMYINWGMLILLSALSGLLWWVVSHFAFGWSWGQSLMYAIFFFPFFLAFFGVALFFTRLSQ